MLLLFVTIFYASCGNKIKTNRFDSRAKRLFAFVHNFIYFFFRFLSSSSFHRFSEEHIKSPGPSESTGVW